MLSNVDSEGSDAVMSPAVSPGAVSQSDGAPRLLAALLLAESRAGLARYQAVPTAEAR